MAAYEVWFTDSSGASADFADVFACEILDITFAFVG